MRDRRPPDFFLIGAPKAGTSALHSALSQHPGLFLSRIKEPKYYMCGDSPPPAYRGPGDAHSNLEWVWQRERYLDLFEPAPNGVLSGESTPFYLYNRDARRRLAADAPEAKLIAVLRDPVDRAYSNWMHLWMDGLEPRARHRRGGPPRAAPDRCRLGAVLALPGTGHVWPAGGRPLRPVPGAADPDPALQAAGRLTRPRSWTACSDSSESSRPTSSRSRRDNSRVFVRDGAAHPRDWDLDPGRGSRRQALPAPRVAQG